MVKTFGDRNLAIYSLAVEKKINQNKVAELLNLSEATVSRRVKVILQKIIKEDMDYDIYSKNRLDAEADYKYYRISGETDSFTDVKVWLFLTQLNRDTVIRYLYCMFGTYQLFHYCYIFLYRFTDKMAALDMNRLLNLLEPYSRLLYERHTRKFGPAFKMLFISLELKCAANLKKVGLYEKSANTAFIEMVRKTANRCHISVNELKDKRIILFAQEKVAKRGGEQFRKAYNIPSEMQHKGKNHKKFKKIAECPSIKKMQKVTKSSKIKHKHKILRQSR